MDWKDQIADLVLHAQEGLSALGETLSGWVETAGLQQPRLTEFQFNLLRQHMPILTLGNMVVVTKYADVVEVLQREDTFHVQYMPVMEHLAGRGTLGMDDTPEYRADAAVLQHAMKSEDAGRLAEQAATLAAAQVAGRAPEGRMDVVRDLFGAVPVTLIAGYFGTPGIDAETQHNWSYALFEAIFGNVRDDPAKLTREQRSVAAGWRYYIDTLIADRKSQLAAGADVPDDLLTRLIRLQRSAEGGIPDEKIRCNLIFMTVGFLPQITKILALAFDELLRRETELAAAQEAARRDDDALVAAYLFEALRFNAETPGLFRRAESAGPITLAAGTPRATVVGQGALVLAATQSAMFDEEVLTAPDQFRVDRPWEHYLYFGAGLHRCFGEYISRAIVPQIANPLLKLPGLRRVPGHNGELKWTGIWPSQLLVEFEAR